MVKDKETQLRFLSTDSKYFWNKVDQSGGPDSGWLWTGANTGRGYGHLRINKIDFTSHRVSWELHNGEIPQDAHVLHSCDNPSCVNPRHLFLGNTILNSQDMKLKDRSNRGSRNRGAKLTEELIVLIRTSLESNSVLASRFNVTERRIREISFY